MLELYDIIQPDCTRNIYCISNWWEYLQKHFQTTQRKKELQLMADSLIFTMTNRQKKAGFWIHLPCLAMKCFSMSLEALSMEPTLPLATLTSRWAVVQQKKTYQTYVVIHLGKLIAKFLPPTGIRPFQNGEGLLNR